MIKVIDDEKEYLLGEGNCLLIQDREDSEDFVQVDAKEFSSFEHDVWCFLMSVQEEV